MSSKISVDELLMDFDPLLSPRVTEIPAVPVAQNLNLSLENVMKNYSSISTIIQSGGFPQFEQNNVENNRCSKQSSSIPVHVNGDASAEQPEEISPPAPSSYVEIEIVGENAQNSKEPSSKTVVVDHKTSEETSATNYNDQNSENIERTVFEPPQSNGQNSSPPIDLNVDVDDAAFYNRSRRRECFYIDTHCHLDSLFDKLKFQGDFSTFKTQNAASWSDCYVGCVTNFVFPELFLKREKDGFFDAILANDDVRATVGCHPRHAEEYTPELENFLITKLSHPKVIAVGETGLDKSRNTKVGMDTQKMAFRRQLKITKYMFPEKPVVIHCREAEMECFEIAKTILDPSQAIHLHCFMGSCESAIEWMDFFPNAYIGVTTSVCSPREQQVELLTQIPLNRILIETDSPYFLPASKATEFQLEYNHPGLANLVAEKLAELRKVDVVDVYNQIYDNTLQVYRDFY